MALHWRVQPATHAPMGEHAKPCMQVPQVPPQPSSPQFLPLHWGRHVKPPPPLLPPHAAKPRIKLNAPVDNHCFVIKFPSFKKLEGNGNL